MSRLVHVSGKPGAGKSSLAFPLAAELGYSLLTKDLIKEMLHDVLKTLPLSAMDEYDRPVGVGSLITVDTTAPVDTRAIAAKIRRLHNLPAW